MVLLEVCCTSLDSALDMLRAGAHRLEICSDLSCGGLTPTWLNLLQPGNFASYQQQPGNFPSAQQQPGNFPSAQQHPGNFASTQQQPGNFPSAQQHPGNFASTQQQSSNIPSSQQQPGNFPSAQQHPRNFPSAQQQPGNFPSAQQHPGNFPSAQQHPRNFPSAQQQPGNFPSTQQQPGNFLYTQQQSSNIPSAQQHPGNFLYTQQQSSNIPSSQQHPGYFPSTPQHQGTSQSMQQPTLHALGNFSPTPYDWRIPLDEFLDRTHVLIRCRPGDYCYSQAEVDSMCESIRLCRQVGVHGVVIGALNPEGDLDLPALHHMIEAATGLASTKTTSTTTTSTITSAETGISTTQTATPDGNDTKNSLGPVDCFSAKDPNHAATQPQPMTLVFHRAFDVCRNPFVALEQIIKLGFSTILTSGQSPNAEAGIPMLSQLVDKAAGRITIMAGKGVTVDNVADIIRQTGVPAVHLSERPGIPEILARI